MINNIEKYTDSKYSSYINKLENVTGKCQEITTDMLIRFPELSRVRGYYHCPIWGKREHWWLKNKIGQIIDPTSSQFPSKGTGEYEEHIEGSVEPTGKCLGCGEYVYDHNLFCSTICELEVVNNL